MMEGHIRECVGYRAQGRLELLSPDPVSGTGRTDGERRSARATRKFKAEAEAKQFAQEMIKEGWSAIAGTLNPHSPKKTVASTQILDWIAGKH